MAPYLMCPAIGKSSLDDLTGSQGWQNPVLSAKGNSVEPGIMICTWIPLHNASMPGRCQPAVSEQR